jgi:Zn-finger protein
MNYNRSVPMSIPKNFENLEVYQYIMAIQLDVLFNPDNCYFNFCPIYFSV